MLQFRVRNTPRSVGLRAGGSNLEEKNQPENDAVRERSCPRWLAWNRQSNVVFGSLSAWH